MQSKPLLRIRTKRWLPLWWYLSLIILLSSFSSCQNVSHRPTPPSPAISSDGVPLFYSVQGAGHPTLLFIHGWSSNRSYWKNQMAYFSKKYQVVTIDLGGHGQSGSNRRNWTMKQYGVDVAAVIRHLKLDEVLLIGHSMSGAVMVETAQILPDKIKGLIGIDTFHDISKVARGEEADTFMRPFVENFTEMVKTYALENLFTPNSDSLVIERVANDLTSAHPQVALYSFRNLLVWDATTALDQLLVPMTLINTDQVPTNEKALNPYHINVEYMSGLGHYLMLEDPIGLNAVLERKISEILTST